MTATDTTAANIADGCTATSFAGIHAYENGTALLGVDRYDDWELCGQQPDAPIHQVPAEPGGQPAEQITRLATGLRQYASDWSTLDRDPVGVALGMIAGLRDDLAAEQQEHRDAAAALGQRTPAAARVATTEPDGRRDPRAMLALVALAVDLPMPNTISHHHGIWSMNFDTIADGQAWSTHLGGKTETYVNNGRRYLNEGVIDWHGWSVQLHAAEDANVTPPDVLNEATTAALTDIAGGEPS